MSNGVRDNRGKAAQEHTWISTLMMVRGATKRVPVMAADSGQNWMVSCRKGLITQSPSICSTQPYDYAILQTPTLKNLASAAYHHSCSLPALSQVLRNS